MSHLRTQLLVDYNWLRSFLQGGSLAGPSSALERHQRDRLNDIAERIHTAAKKLKPAHQPKEPTS